MNSPYGVERARVFTARVLYSLNVALYVARAKDPGTPPSWDDLLDRDQAGWMDLVDRAVAGFLPNDDLHGQVAQAVYANFLAAFGDCDA